MKCKYCGNEIEDGKVYCSVCGKPVQIVPDYSPLEDDLLPQFVSDEKKEESSDGKVSEKNISSTENTKSKDEKFNSKNNIKNFLSQIITKKRIIILIFIIVIVSIILITYFSPKNQINYGDSAYEKEDYGGALTYYLVASNIDDSAELFSKIGNTYYNLNDEDNAKRYYEKALNKDSKNYEAFEGLINIAVENLDYSALNDLSKQAVSKKQKALYQKYYVPKVKFSKDGGDYIEDIELTLSNSKNYDIYYTLDGTTPDKTNGTLYTDPIELSDGDTIVTARCVNKNSFFGEVSSNEYKISYETPDMPTVTPDAGNYNVPTEITISCNQKNAAIYYAWDETEPSINSTRYTGPIAIPEGSHILSAIAINSNGLSSAIYRGNFVYEPGAVFPDDTMNQGTDTNTDGIDSGNSEADSTEEPAAAE